MFIVVGAFLVVAYNLELLGGAFHSDLWFALAWGGFPALTGAFAQTGRLDDPRRSRRGARASRSAPPSAPCPRPCAASGAGSPTSKAPSRYRDGTTEPIGAEVIRSAPETALQLLSIAMPVLAVASVMARTSSPVP